jgi:alcohol dehydrogenase class IV
LGQPTDHKCNGIEVKTLVLFATDEPQKREIFAEVCEASTLTNVSSGLFRQANIRQQDDIIGLGGGPARQVL